jgi:hypothetical protein
LEEGGHLRAPAESGGERSTLNAQRLTLNAQRLTLNAEPKNVNEAREKVGMRHLAFSVKR